MFPLNFLIPDISKDMLFLSFKAISKAVFLLLDFSVLQCNVMLSYHLKISNAEVMCNVLETMSYAFLTLMSV